MTSKKRTILVYGRTNSGKSYLAAELAEHVKKTEGRLTRLYTGDKGGTDTLAPHIELGIVQVIEQGDTDPFVFWNKAVRGFVRDDKGKWVQDKSDKIGLWVFEGITAMADAFMASMTKKVGEGTSIGGTANVAFSVAGDGESLKVSGSNMAMYGICQSRCTDEIWESMKLPGQFILWTASASKDEDVNAAGKVIGPAMAGKALTAEIPRWFNLTFRVDALPAQGGAKERHVLFLGNHVDVGAGNSVGLGNLRLPPGAPPPEKTTIEPASLVQAIQMIDGSNKTAVEALRKRLA